ncbi:lipase [Catellatospora sp. IY07-71]|uniref:lipase family protein n=1 Tax=Catellatospora sp. IY07-71 TaxID=2728827 RepID=UPI001BB2F8DA|nr:lipase family protein [Catellatospora sp. IY07-71]BCJ76442.1 lipase [Catellatospora sp. IY07-71]
MAHPDTSLHHRPPVLPAAAGDRAAACRTLRWSAAVVACLVAVSATPAAAAPATAVPHSSGSRAPGTPVAVEPLPEPLRPAGSGPAWRLRYLSTSWNGHPAVVSGTITLPAGTPPAGGWRVVSFGPGFNGTPDRCAASQAGTPPFIRPLSEALLRAGYAVAVTDYEGIGTPGESSVVHGPAEAYAMVDIVRAARRLAPVSRRWAAAGYSLGGHAALWTGSLADGYAPSLRHVGTIAIAPTTQWGLQFAAAGNPAAPVNPAVPYQGRTLPVTHPGGFHAADWFTPAGLSLIDLAGHVCIEQMATALTGLTMADVFTDPPAAMDEFTALFDPHEVPVRRYSRPVRLAHGTADQLPAVLTEITAGQLAAAGTDVTYTPVSGADHFTVAAAIAPHVVQWLEELFTRP